MTGENFSGQSPNKIQARPFIGMYRVSLDQIETRRNYPFSVLSWLLSVFACLNGVVSRTLLRANAKAIDINTLLCPLVVA